jgi:methionine--tRNA ligase beta chain
MKRIILVHSWDNKPTDGWFPWLKAELEKRGYLVVAPQLPHAEKPTMEEWIPALALAVGKPDANTYFVGHSMGVIAILKYLETLPESVRVGGVLSVAGFLEKPIHNSPEDDLIAAPWFAAPLASKVQKIAEQVHAIFSPTDKWVRIENKKLFESQLKAETYIEDGKGERGHFSGHDGVVELPKALELILSMSATPIIAIDDLAKIEIKMGTILTAEKVEGADKLLKFSVDLGGEVRTIVSGVAQHYAPESMLGRQVPVVTNLAPRKMKGVESNGMILYAIDETITNGSALHKPVMLNPEKSVPNGSPVQ